LEEEEACIPIVINYNSPRTKRGSGAIKNPFVYRTLSQWMEMATHGTVSSDSDLHSSKEGIDCGIRIVEIEAVHAVTASGVKTCGGKQGKVELRADGRGTRAETRRDADGLKSMKFHS